MATQDPRRARALDVGDKSLRVERYQRATVEEACQIIASMGLRSPADLRPHMLRRVVGPLQTRSYAQMYDWLDEGELLADPPESWADD